MDISGFSGELLHSFRILSPVMQILAIALLACLAISCLALVTLTFKQQRLKAEIVKQREISAKSGVHDDMKGDIVYAVYRAPDHKFDAYWYQQAACLGDEASMRHHNLHK